MVHFRHGPDHSKTELLRKDSRWVSNFCICNDWAVLIWNGLTGFDLSNTERGVGVLILMLCLAAIAPSTVKMLGSCEKGFLFSTPPPFPSCEGRKQSCYH